MIEHIGDSAQKLEVQASQTQTTEYERVKRAQNHPQHDDP